MPKNETKPYGLDDLTPSEKKRNESITNSLNNMINQMELSIYGTTKKNDHSALVNQFNDLLKNEMDGLNHSDGQSITTFMGELFKQDTRISWNNPNIESFLNSDDGQITTFLSDAYQNKMLKYADLQEISSQLIELREAINIMRDAIVSPDVNDGGISRNFNFEFESEDVIDEIRSHMEFIETKFKLQSKIKDHVVPKTLTYGNYYAYVLPYSKIFSDFKKKMVDPINGASFLSDARTYTESPIIESFKEENDNGKKTTDEYFMECASDFVNQFDEKEIKHMTNTHYGSELSKDKFVEKVKDEIEAYMNNITVCNDEVPLPFITESPEALEEYAKLYMEDTRDLFTKVTNVDAGVYGKDYKKSEKKIDKEFENFSDCYIKLVDPMHMFPLKILNKPIGYFYIQEDEIKPVNGIMTSTTYYNKYNNSGRQRSIIDNLVHRIVMSFDKKFLRQNSELKDVIAEALTYYDLNTKRLKFQFIPAEYVCEFKVNENENEEGVSMIEPSLFYAKLYLMLLLFKITSIILYSNDQKVNYVRTSGIDKNISNKIQEIARDKQNHQVNIMDLMSYTTLLKKVGNGTEMYIPTGRNGERGFETEILQGQDVQLNTELMELLRNCYILGTGVPQAIMNYMNEADFAKSLELANTRFQGRVMSYQINFNESITEFYRLVAKHSGAIDVNKIKSFTVTLTAPKFANNLLKQEALTAFDAIRTFILNLLLGETWNQNPELENVVREITKRLVRKYLPSIDIDEVLKWYEEIKLENINSSLNPENKGKDNLDVFADDLE